MKRLLFCIAVCIMMNNVAQAQTYDTLVRWGATWKFLDDGSSQDATSWKLSAFADATWDSGAAPLGFGDSWIATCIDPGCISIIPCTPVCLNINITDYFRKTLNIASVSAYEDSVKVFGQIDDGIVMYVNGTKVWSVNMPATVNSTTQASSTINGADETKIDSVSIPMSAFVNGANIVAVELHQQGGTTSDATLDMMMRFRRKPVVTGVRDATINANVFTVFPNPSKGRIMLMSGESNFSEVADIAIYDVTGRQIMSKQVAFTEGKGEISVDAGPGVYLVHITSANSHTQARLIIE